MTKKDDFGFTYIVQDVNSWSNVTYSHKEEAWYFKSKSTETKDEGQPYDIDVKLKVFAPGWVPATPTGIETEGYNKTGDWNPQTMYGLSYYITAPQLEITGTASLGDGKGKRTIRGTAWMEHQWGNFRGYSNLHSRYNWAWARLDNGDLLTYRQWHASDAADKENGPADLSQNRYIYIRKLGGGKYATESAMGPTTKYTPAKYHTINGQRMPLWAKLDTPQGTFYLAPEFPNQQAKTAVGLFFWEGVKYLYSDPQLTKPHVGRMFAEFFEVPNSKFDFVRQRPKQDLARALDGGFPELPADVATAVYPKREIKNLYRFTDTATESGR